MFGIIHLHHFPILELLERGHGIFRDRFIGRLYGKFQNVGVRRRERLTNLGEVGNFLVLHHLEERVGCHDADAADVILRVPRMDAGGGIDGLRYRAGRFHAGHGGRLIDAEALRIFFIDLHGAITKFAQR